MKFKFELDGIDSQNFFGMFQSQSIAIMTRVLDIEMGRYDYVKTEDIPSWIRGCINELLEEVDAIPDCMVPSGLTYTRQDS